MGVRTTRPRGTHTAPPRRGCAHTGARQLRRASSHSPDGRGDDSDGRRFRREGTRNERSDLYGIRTAHRRDDGHRRRTHHRARGLAATHEYQQYSRSGVTVTPCTQYVRTVSATKRTSAPRRAGGRARNSAGAANTTRRNADPRARAPPRARAGRPCASKRDK
ncbi:hypothetical protein EVAR_50916_1 [Eumeta japonica]|uniref:Uncharacterized protein n=1 Tax=Eumeta variegata TaxID=151549 RepID=A0A4C1Y6N7_EUMVA|nr:hypothetical protein EVAR_50916_1 [Eumeta japonica]